MSAAGSQCQPCQNFTDDVCIQGLPNVHECFAPFDDSGDPRCGGIVRFCTNCNSDHHDGGYQTCKGLRSCRRNHPACLAAIANK